MKHIIDEFNQTSTTNPSETILKLYDDVTELKELDNRGLEIKRPLFGHSRLPDWLGITEIHINDFKFNEPFIYSVRVHHNMNLWAKHINKIPAYILECVRNRQCKLIFDDIMEGNHNDKFLDIIYNSIDKLNLPASKIYYVTNNLHGERNHKTWVSIHKQSDCINVISIMYNVLDIQMNAEVLKLPKSVNIKDEIEYKRNNLHTIKHFLKVNRTNRLERNLFMLFMNKYNILDKSLISFPAFPNENTYGLFPELTTKENKDSLKSKVPFHIDITDETNVGDAGHEVYQFNADLPFRAIHYRNSLISIVMCPFPFIPNACHLHSSTYNPMYCGQPVIQFGPYQHLKEMRERGFKTFGKWWDESYDNEPHHWKRFKMVMDVVNELSNKPIDVVFDMIEEMQNILQHNSDLIKKYKGRELLINQIIEK